jgi:hypothetical protein
MKKQFFKTTAIKAYSTALLTSALLLTGFNPAQATAKQTNSGKAEVSYVGSTNNLVTFNVNYDNTSEENFVLELTNDQGEVLFLQKFNDKTFNKNFLIRHEGDKCRIYFTIRAGKNTTTQKFELNPQPKQIQEIVVTKS